MSDDLRDKLKAEIMQGLWADLKPHAERGAVILVSEDLDLVEVGEKVVRDEAESIQKWINEAQLLKPSNDQLKGWDAIESKSFRFLIVRPYVLIQEQAH